MPVTRNASRYMPTSAEDTKILEARAVMLAEKVVDAVSSVSSANFIRFRLDERNAFGVSYDYVKEVIQNFQVTPLPKLPAYIAGVTNYRGYLLTIVNLNAMFNIKRDDEKSSSYIIVVVNGMTSIGIMASFIDGSEYYNLATLDAPLPIDSTSKQDFIQGLHNGTVAILNIDKIILFCQEHLKQLSVEK